MALKRKGAKRQKRSEDANAEEYVEPEKLRLRNTYGTKINECLLQGLEEVKREDPSFGMTEDAVRKLTNAICDACHDYYSHDRRGFKQKMFDIYSNLKRENNCDLRRKIITKEMSVTQLIRADTRELAPYHLQRKRQLELEKHYLRNVILPGEMAGQADSPEAQVPVLPPLNGADGSKTDSTEATSPHRSSEAGSAQSFDTISDGFLFSNDNSPDSPSDSEQDESESDDASEHESEQSHNEGSETAQQQGIGATDETGIGDSTEQLDKDAEQPQNDDASPEGLSFLRQQRKLNSEEDEGTRLPAPPDGSNFTLDKVLARLEDRLENLPAYIAKPFRGPLKCGQKRITLLMGRSPILNQTSTQDKKPQI